jgi:SAM-dependent methyltransferase
VRSGRVSAEDRQRYGQVFDSVAAEYDRERRSYPPELVDAALALGGLVAGDTVLEVGCGTGLLTEQLVARGLRVHALDPGAEMVSRARRRVGADAPVEFEIARFEEVCPAGGPFPALFSASAWHWLEPAASWRRAWEALVPGGRLCLLQDFGVADPRAARDIELLTAAFKRGAPELAAVWPAPRDPEAVLREAREHEGDVSAVWSHLTNYALEDPSAADLFDDVRVDTVPLLIEQTADQFNAYFATTSFHARLEPAQRDRLAAENRQAAEELGGVLRYGVLAVLVSARRI